MQHNHYVDFPDILNIPSLYAPQALAGCYRNFLRLNIDSFDITLGVELVAQNKKMTRLQKRNQGNITTILRSASSHSEWYKSTNAFEV